MGTSDNFCLRWNDFETNISSSFRELRRDSEFFDVTLCCDNGSDKVSAHKVILAACSPLFRRILQNNSDTPKPLLYLKGVKKKELLSVLNFMYHGEVNVAQESLNAFLAVAEDLAVKGLTTDSNFESAPSRDSGRTADNGDGSEADQASKAKKAGFKKILRTPLVKKRQTDGTDDLEDVKRVKAEPESANEKEGTSGAQEEFVDDEGDPDFDIEGLDETYGEQLDGLDKDGSGGGEGSKARRKLREAADFAQTQTGKPVLLDKEGHAYLMRKPVVPGKKTYWRCRHRNYGCKARAHTSEQWIVFKSDNHDHRPQPFTRLIFDSDTSITSERAKTEVAEEETAPPPLS